MYIVFHMHGLAIKRSFFFIYFWNWEIVTITNVVKRYIEIGVISMCISMDRKLNEHYAKHVLK